MAVSGIEEASRLELPIPTIPSLIKRALIAHYEYWQAD